MVEVEPCACASADGGAWETFWSCNDGGGEARGGGGQRAGLNGVATLVAAGCAGRKGFKVTSTWFKIERYGHGVR